MTGQLQALLKTFNHHSTHIEVANSDILESFAKCGKMWRLGRKKERNPLEVERNQTSLVWHCCGMASLKV